MARYIDADALKHRMFNYYGCVNENTGKDNYRGETLMCYEVADMIEDCIDNAPTADVVPKSEEGAECPTCHGTGRIGTTDWLTKNISKKQLAEEKAQAIAEHEQHIKTDVAREIFEEIEKAHDECIWIDITTRIGYLQQTKFEYKLAELKKKYTEGEK